jgi:hypothetical protein
MKDFLTEQSLDLVLYQLFNVKFINNQSFSRYRADWYSPDLSIIIEFDGYYHYSDSLTQFRDSQKDRLYRSLGLKCIRIPYFVQICTETIKYFFNINFNYSLKYQHGFIDSNALLPANYNELGVIRFRQELSSFPTNICVNILQSLIAKSNTMKGTDFEKLLQVFPKSFLSTDLKLNDPNIIHHILTINHIKIN